MKKKYNNEELNKVRELPTFQADLWTLLSTFSEGSKAKALVTSIIWNDLPLWKAISPTWLVYSVTNELNDEDLEGDYLSELVVDMEYLIDDIEKIVEKHKKYL